MEKTVFALWIALVAALGMEYGCASPNANRPGSGKIELDGKTYKEKYTCNEQFGGVPPTTCPDLNKVDTIGFLSTGPNTFEVRDVPDNGYVLTGTLSGDTFIWSATSPLGYTETGTWIFSASADTFTGTSHYVATDNTYAGDCNENGALGSGSIPPDPPLPTGCP